VVEAPPVVEKRAEKPLLDAPLSLPIVAKPVVEAAAAPAKAKEKPEVDEGAFWSDGDDDNDDDAPIDIKLPDDDDDDLVLKPNPLVTGRARAVDLTASIRSYAEDQKRELAPPPVEEPPPLPPPRGESLSRSHFTETESSPTDNHGTQIMYYKRNWKNLLIFGWFVMLPEMACLTFPASAHQGIGVDSISEVEAHMQ
jgi:hypothetical protein